MKAIFVLAAVALAAPSVAAPAAAFAGDTAKKDDKSSKMICRAQGETGSRLGGKKVCMTQAQWDEHRRAIKQDLERGQMQQINKQGS